MSEPNEHPNTPDDDPGLPRFSRRLGAPIATVKPVGKPPSQVSGLPAQGGAVDRETGAPAGSGNHPGSTGGEPKPPGGADLGFLPNPDGSIPAAPPASPKAPSAPAPAAPAEGGGPEQQSFYDAVGGRETFQTIVDVFYDEVAEDEGFRSMYPEEDLGPAKERLLMFLEQYWGGPRTYQEQRGHPRLRMRHMPFRVDAEARDKWLRFMRRGVEAANLSPMHEEILWDYLERAAHSMVNS